jgi:hypothetical protein
MQNYPNPARKSTTIEFALSKSQNTSIDLFDLNGNKVLSLLNGYIEKGKHKIEFSTQELQSGVYFYTLRTTEEKITKKMVVKR